VTMPLSDEMRAQVNNFSENDIRDLLTMIPGRFESGARGAYRFAASVYLPLMDEEVDGEDVDGPFALRTARELIDSTPEPPPAIAEGILPDKRLVILSGESKFGKSLLLLDMLACIAAGEPLWGEIDTGAPGLAVYYCMEDGAIEAKERFLSMELSATALDNIRICTQQRLLSDPENWAKVEQMIAELPERPKVVAIDTMREAYACSDWNDQSKVPAILRPLRKWARQNTLMLLVHHTNKTMGAEGVNRVAGSGAIVSSCDGVLLCENKRVLDNGDLAGDVMAVGRSGMKGKFTVRMDTTTHRWRVQTGAELDRLEREKKLEQMEPWYDAIERAILALDGAASVEAIATHTAKSPAATRNRITEMEAVNRLSRGEKIKNGKGQGVITYTLPNRSNNNISPLYKGQNVVVESSADVPGATENGTHLEEFFGAIESNGSAAVVAGL